MVGSPCAPHVQEPSAMHDGDCIDPAHSLSAVGKLRQNGVHGEIIESRLRERQGKGVVAAYPASGGELLAEA